MGRALRDRGRTTGIAMRDADKPTMRMTARIVAYCNHESQRHFGDTARRFCREPTAAAERSEALGFLTSNPGDLNMAPEKLDAVALLKADHRKVEGLFAQFEAAKGDGKKQALAMQICMELTVHTKIEEDVFYPACEGKVENDLLKEAYVEHDGAKVLIAEIEAGGPDDEFYDAKVKVLSEQIEHHVKEEEQRVEGMFAQARKAGLDMDALGETMAAEKLQLIASYKASGLPTPATPTLKATKIGQPAA
jgi:hemerythrin superfamily protein